MRQWRRNRGGDRTGLATKVMGRVHRGTPAGGGGEVASECKEVNPDSRGSLASGLVGEV